ncbi:MAG TPA: hypothetical protein VES73_05720, partial [Lamprocystis sp. (in: g-proteobacteria)]|nr:hypothetical protein [Lamprocystis sp. (in: g-proteobacteria)]
MQKPNAPHGLRLRGEIWHFSRTIKVGRERIQLRESTGCRSVADAQEVMERRVHETRELLLNGPTKVERTYREAAAEYIADLESRGKDSARSLQDVRMLDDILGGLPVGHVHQGTLKGWIASQRGVRASGTIDRALRTVTTILTFAARVLRDSDTPWLSV